MLCSDFPMIFHQNDPKMMPKVRIIARPGILDPIEFWWVPLIVVPQISAGPTTITYLYPTIVRKTAIYQDARHHFYPFECPKAIIHYLQRTNQ